MVFYHGLNFLQHALSAKRSLLERCLIPVPQHISANSGLEEFLPCNEDQKPWTRVTVAADDAFLIEAATFVQEEARNLKTCSTTLDQLESFDSCSSNGDDTSFDKALFVLDCDLVPSSNPSSAEDFTPDNFFSEERKEPIEYFMKEDLRHFSTKQEHLKIEILSSPNNNLQDVLKNYPSFKKVQSRLKAEALKDPLEFDMTLEQTENKIFALHAPFDGDNRAVEQCEKKQTESTSWPQEIFSKFDLDRSTGLGSCEEFCCLETFEDNVPIDSLSILKKLVSRDTFVFKTGEVEDSKTMLSNIICNLSDVPEAKIEKMNESTSDGTQAALTFQAINDMDTETDKFCDSAILEIPSELDNKINAPPILLPDRTAGSQVPPISHLCVIDERKKTVIEKALFLSDRFRADEHAARLTEPQLPGLELDMHDEVQSVKQLRRIVVDDRLMTSETMLCWSVDKDMQEDLPAIQCEKLECGSKREDQAQNLKVDAVECVQKYSAADMYDWKDPFLNVDNQPREEELAAKLERTKEVEMCKEAKSSTAGLDPLEAFMALRARQTATVRSNKIDDKAQLKDSKNNDLVTTISTDSACQQMVQTVMEESQPLSNVPQQSNSTHTVSEAQRPTKHHVITVNLSDDFLQILDQLTKAAASHLAVLKRHRQISPHDSIMSIKSDASRFLIKQREQFIKDNQLDADSDEEYRSLIIVHGLVTAVDITSKCCLESTIGYLSALQDKYSSVLMNSLDSVRQRLFELKAWFSQRKIYHPKVAATCKEIELWLKKKRIKSKDTEQKILVLVKHDMPSLLSCLKSALAEGRLLIPDVLSIVQPDMVIKSLDSHNCLIVHKPLVDDRFPWCQFSLVVEYDYEPGSSWQDLCHRQSIRHIGVQLELSNMSETAVTIEQTAQFLDKQICLIASQTVTDNTELLQLLETRENILLLERNYSTLETRNIFFSDLDIDENSGIILASIHSLSDDNTLLKLITRVTALSLKYSHCWIVLCPDRNTSSYPLTSHVVNNVCKLEGAVNNFKRKLKSFTAKVIMCFDASRLASVIRGISEKVLVGDAGDQELDSKFDRSWLMPEMSQEEKLLLSIRCISSFSAQMLLMKVGLRSLFSACREDLVSWVPEMPPRIIQTFMNYVNSSTGLQLLRVGHDTPSDDYNFEEYEASQSNVRENSKGNKINTCRYMNETREITNNEVTEKGGNCNIGNEKPLNLSVPEDFQVFVTDNEFEQTNTLQGLEIDDKRYPQTKRRLNQTAKPTFESSSEDVRRSNLENSYVNTYQSNMETYEAKEHAILGECYDNSTPEKQRFANENITNSSVGFGNHGQFTSPLDFHDRQESDNSTGHCCSNGKVNSEVTGFTNFPRTSEQFRMNGKGRNIDMVPNNATIHGSYKENLLDIQKVRSVTEASRVYSKQRFPGNSPRHHSSVRDGDTQETMCFTDSRQAGYQLGVQKSVPYIFDKSDNNQVSECESKAFQEQSTASCDRNYSGISVSTKQQTAHQQPISSNDNIYPTYGPILFQNEYGRLTETFDYNHGLPIQEKVANSVKDISMDSTDRYGQCDIDPRYIQGLNERAKEFPPSEEVHNSFLCSSNSDMEMYKADVNSNLQVSISLSENKAFNTEQGNTNGDPFDLEIMYKPEMEKANQAENRLGGVRSLTIRRGSDHIAGETLEMPLNNCKSYMNPNLMRVTRRPDCLTNNAQTQPNHTPTKQIHIPGSNGCLEKDLRETTRKLLLNTQQFASLGKSVLRNSSHKINIGLAQPVQRQASTPSNIQTEDQALMQQSLWTNNDSPPMDLGFDSSQLDKTEGQSTSNGTSNKLVITSHTPQKKRRLTYQPIPGKKGQTKLVFR